MRMRTQTSLMACLVVGLACALTSVLAEELRPPDPIPWKTGGEVVLFPDKPGGRFYVLPAGRLPDLEAILPQVPDEENSVPWYFEAMRRYTKPKDAYKFYDFAWGQRKFDQNNPELQAWLKSNEVAFRYLDRAAEVKSARWPLLDILPDPQAKGVRTPLYLEMQLPHLARLREFARARSLLARKALAEGKIDQVVREIRLAYAIPRHLDDQPFLIEGLVSIACDSIILQALEELLVSGNLSREQLETLAKVLDERRASLGDGTRAFLGEELGSKQAVDLFLTPYGLPDLTVFEHPGQVEIEKAMWLIPTKLPGTRAFRILLPDQTMKAQIGRYFQAMRARLKQPYFQAFSAGEEEDPLLGLIPRWNLVARMFLPVLHRASMQYAMRKVTLDMSRVAVALKRAERDGLGRPEQLDRLVPKYLTAIPVDELNGKPLHYSPREGGWRVWSVGRDFKDDGGTRKNWGEPDLVFFVEEAPGRMENIRKD